MSPRIVIRDQDRWLEFAEPVAVLEARTTREVRPVLDAVERRIAADGLHAAGYVAYEAAPGFDAALTTRPNEGWPLVSFGLYRAPAERAMPGPADETDAWPDDWAIDVARADYERHIRRIRRQIALGNTYQVNYTIRAAVDRIGDPWQLFRRIASDAPYAAFIDSDDYAIVCASPELFFRLDGHDIESRPMKGTARRGLTPDEDERLREWLGASAKDRAENVMIADMIRNDIGRIAEPGSVSARDLFRVERYPTVWQMTSTIAARTAAPVAEIFSALFPCASVTGAPKVSSMALIADLEASPRHVYTGAIGWLAPGRRAQFNVAIRTAFVDKRRARASYGAGGGIVWNSNAADEYEECLTKARILYRRPSRRQFRLLETLRFEPGDGYFLAEAHLRRLRRSARYFDFPCDEAGAWRALRERASTLAGGTHRVRLLLAEDGEWLTSAAPVPATPAEPAIVKLATHPVDADDPFLYHKTTWREVYERARRDAGRCDDVLLWNRDGYVTETTIANVLVWRDGRLCTPPVGDGLLAGTLRERLLAEGRVQECRIAVTSLSDGDELLLINSVRGEYPAVLRIDTRAERAATSSPGRT